MKGKRYTKEFKQEAVQLALSSSDPIKDVASRLGIGYSTLKHWMGPGHLESHGEDESMLSHKDLMKENKRLKKELAKAKQVEEILKKAAAYFANETQ